MGEYGTDSFLAMLRRRMFPVGFVVVGTVMGIFLGSARFTLFSMFGNFLNLLPPRVGTVVSGLVVFYGMAGCLGLAMRESVIALPRLLASLLRGGWSLPLVLTLLIMLVIGLPRFLGMRKTLLWKWLSTPISGLMGVGLTILLAGLRLQGLVYFSGA